jgi:hypothetical protein
MGFIQNMDDTPPNSFKNSNANSKVKIMKEKVKVSSLTHNILGVKKVCWNFRMGTRTHDR